MPLLSAITHGLKNLFKESLRVIPNSYKTAWRVMSCFWNWSLPEDMQMIFEEDTRNHAEKFAWGLPGLFLGSFSGVLGYSVVGFFRILWNSARAFRDISGGIFNVTLEREIFKGLQNPAPHANRWGLGGPGILLAITVTGILGAGVFGIRKLVPLSLGLLTSPITALWRGARELWKYKRGQFRFSQINAYKSESLHRLKLLFTMLTPWGELPEDVAQQLGAIQPNDNDAPHYTRGFFKNLFKFVRKCLTFNKQTLTEQVFSRFAAKVQMVEKKSVDLNPIVNETIQEIIARYKEDSDWTTPQSKKQSISEEVRSLGEILKDYVVKDDPGKLNAHHRCQSRSGDLFFSRFAKEPESSAPEIKSSQQSAKKYCAT